VAVEQSNRLGHGVTAAQAATLRWFAPAEFHHPELVNYQAASWLDSIRGVYGKPLVLTSDARTADENAAASGSSPPSLHLLGRAFDLRLPSSPEDLWAFVVAVYRCSQWRSVEVELVSGPNDKHVHIGLYPADRPSRLELALT